jgi:hypothetical protein
MKGVRHGNRSRMRHDGGRTHGTSQAAPSTRARATTSAPPTACTNSRPRLKLTRVRRRRRPPRRFIPARCIPRSARTRRAPAPSAAWRWSRCCRPPRLRRHRPPPNTSARCTPKSCAASRGTARSAAWRWTPHRHAGGGGESRARRHEPALLVQQRAGPASAHHCDGRRPGARVCRPLPVPRRHPVAAVRARHPGGAVGRLAPVPARLGLAGQPQPQHVHPHRARRGGRVGLQRGGARRPRVCSRRRCTCTAWCRCISRRRR